MWIENHPLLSSLDSESKSVINASSRKLNISQGSIIFRPGDQCKGFPFVISGSIKVYRISETGKQFLLYNVTEADTCIITTASIISDVHYNAEAVAQTDVLMYILPIKIFNSLLSSSGCFRSAIFSGYSYRISSLMNKIEQIVCVPIISRLADRLLEIAGEDKVISITHQALADDLATAREVIGRKLKKFEKMGWIKQKRGLIEILDRKELQNIDGKMLEGGYGE